MTNTSQRLATCLGCGCGSLLAACGSASGSNPPKSARLDARAHAVGRDNACEAPQETLINTIQGTADKSDPCFIHYTTPVVSQTSHRISIELLARDREDRPVGCAAKAVRGPFLVPLHLEKRYRERRLLDPATGRFHRLIPRSELS